MIDWMTVPEIKRRVERMQELSSSDDEAARGMANAFLFETGRRLPIVVIITDPEIARIALSSIYTDIDIMPGMKIQSIELGTPGKETIRQWLRDRLVELDGTL